VVVSEIAKLGNRDKNMQSKRIGLYENIEGLEKSATFIKNALSATAGLKRNTGEYFTISVF